MSKTFKEYLEVLSYQSSGNPSIYVASLSDYNAGDLEGKWFDLTKYDSGDELMEDIDAMLQEISDRKNDGEIREEWAIHDHEYVGDYVGENADLNGLVEAVKVSQETDMPMSVVYGLIGNVVSSISDVADYINDNYIGKFNSNKELAESLVDDMGVESISNIDHYLSMTDTDVRLIAGDLVDSEEIENEDEAADRLKEIEREIKKDPVQYMIDQGFYANEEELAEAVVQGKSTGFYVDYEMLGRDLAMGMFEIDGHYFWSR